jgi:hypothetical protein
MTLIEALSQFNHILATFRLFSVELPIHSGLGEHLR